MTGIITIFLEYAFSGILQFCGAFLLAALVLTAFGFVVRLAAYPIQVVAVSWNRVVRHLNIRAHGWPPAHLDADGEQIKPTDTTP